MFLEELRLNSFRPECSATEIRRREPHESYEVSLVEIELSYSTEGRNHITVLNKSLPPDGALRKGLGCYSAEVELQYRSLGRDQDLP